MADVEIMARVGVGGGAPVERLVCHPRLPFVAGLSSARPMVHVWGCEGGELRELGTVGGDAADYDDVVGWERITRTPGVAWHPDEPLLLVASEGTVTRWTPAGISALDGLPPAAAYRRLAFSPDGRTLWAMPSASDAEDDDNDWGASDTIDLGTGKVAPARWWDTGIAAHPGGGLVLTYRSDQGATLGLFARVTQDGAMRTLRRALILDVDGYEEPIFSRDGRHFAIRGNAYDQTLEVFNFPSLERVLGTILGDPNPGYPYPDEWVEQMRAWSRHNTAFGAEPGVLWIGTPDGELLRLDVTDQEADQHDVLAGSPVTALAAMATGELVVASGGGELVLVSVPAGAAAPRDAAALRALVTTFVDSTSDVPDDDEDLEEHLVVTDGTRTWEMSDWESVLSAEDTDPTWLQLQAAINNARDQEK
ncbi:hypothetical protein GCM10009682_34020 [Luedemannella flava]|uniref:WD40 repeat domain-containing protein n=1 Tax=Luedemannella flava TaxID=349316 RepID=A0ABN2M4J8_9ACTN